MPANDDDPRLKTKAVILAGIASLRFLRKNPIGARFVDIRQAVEDAGCKNHSDITVRRGLRWLRVIHDCPLDPDTSNDTWTLRDTDFTLPLDDPTPADLTAAIFAAALIGPMVSPKFGRLLEHLVAEMDARMHDLHDDAPAAPTHAIAASVTTGTPVDPRHLGQIMHAIMNGQVLRIQYFSPWQNKEAAYEIEPWQCRVHDGTMYLRAWSRGRKEPRNFRVVQIRNVVVLEGQVPRGERPPPGKIWGDDPAFGVDDDRPDVAVIRIKGGFARWVALDRWHPEQQDTWIEDGELLERRVPYRSCREFARRLLTLGDSLVAVGPAALREEVVGHASVLAERLG